jgi:hypothetical protein
MSHASLHKPLAHLLLALGMLFQCAAIAQPASPHPSGSRASSAQRAEAMLRFERAKTVVAQVAGDAQALGLHPGWENATLATLLARSSSELAALGRLTSYRAIHEAAVKSNAKALGDPSTDLVFRPLAPCRIIDTRFAGGKIAGTRPYDLNTLPCGLSGIADGAIAALVVNVTILDTSEGAPGFLNVRPAGSSQVTALLNWFIGSASAQVSNAAIVPVDQGAAVNDVEIVTSSPVHVIVDVFGMFVSPAATALNCTTVQTNVTNAAPGQFSQFNSFCAAGYSITGGGCHYFNTDGTPATENTVSIHKNTRAYDPVAQMFLNGWLCSLTNNDMVKSFNFGNRAVCCRVPGS